MLNLNYMDSTFVLFCYIRLSTMTQTELSEARWRWWAALVVLSNTTWTKRTQMLRLNSGSASFRGAFEGQLCHNQSEGSSKCSFFSLFLEDAPLLSSVASQIPRFFLRPKKNKEREKMATSRAVVRHFRGPGRQKSWRKRKTSGDTTRKCSKS